jgi:hypothetical protein
MGVLALGCPPLIRERGSLPPVPVPDKPIYMLKIMVPDVVKDVQDTDTKR